ncbi:unnamed protein product [Paramecium octaurelia]|uniref:Uncharacterized protein n=1 Tax=Paramecium octaurelia TaxID=43137 RepID=A0A8S1VN69_PAROT|nr:unnamed protein product [Paramecium octaurelia]
MQPKKHNSNLSNSKIEKKQLEEKVNQFIQDNDGLSTSDLISKASMVKKSDQKSTSQNKKLPIAKQQEQKIGKPPTTKETEKQIIQQKPVQIKKEEAIQQNNVSQTESMKTTSTINERQLQVKLKEKQREMQLLNDKVKNLESDIMLLKNQNREYQELLNEKTMKTTLHYNQRRFLLLSQNILSKQQQIFRMTQIVQLTRQIQYELENQLINLRETMESIQDTYDGAYKLSTFCDKQLERLRYIQSQQLHEQEVQFEQKNNSQKHILLTLSKVDACISEVVNLFDSNRQQYNFIDDQLISKLDALSINLNRVIQCKELPNINLKPNLVILQEEFHRTQGTFNSIFPHYNSVSELIKKQIQNDLIYSQLEDISKESKELKNCPLAIRQINILRSLVIHCLLSIHTFNFRPTFKPFFEIIQPFLQDCQGIFDQYQDNNQQMGQQVIWELWKSSHKNLQQCTENIAKEVNQMKQEYSGYWNHKIFDLQQK